MFFLTGYGLANLQSKTKMDPDKSLVYLASVTKTFTATAVLQLIEKGKLDLNRDVNMYLKSFELEKNYSDPVSLTNLLTHTAGFDDKKIGYIIRFPSEVFKLSEYLAEEMPRRVMPPGVLSSYSNHGFGPAGHLVELASGLSYSKYLEKNIFKPLGMNSSQAFLSLAEDKKQSLATGYNYDYRRNRLEPCFLGLRNLAPAGFITTTGTDMAKFLISLFKDSEINKDNVFPGAVKKRMFTRQFSHHPKLACLNASSERKPHLQKTFFPIKLNIDFISDLFVRDCHLIVVF